MKRVVSYLYFLNFSTTLFTVCYFIPTASAQIPTFQMELLSSQPEVLEYKYPFNNVFVSAIPIPASSPKRVNDELVIYWRNNNPNHNADLKGLRASPTEIKIKLTCRAPYWTKWEINSDVVESGSEQMRDASEFKYSLRLLPRVNEDPVSMSTDNAVKWEYNLTEVTINSFGSKFQSGTIDCVHHNNSQIKSRLRIFKRFVDINVNPFRSSVNKSLNYKTTSAIPCTVHDPVKVPYFESTKKGSDNWKKVNGDFDYKWTIGFEPKEAKALQVNTKYRCVFFEKCFDFWRRVRQCILHNVEYATENADAQKNEEDSYKKKDISSIVRNKVFKSVDGNGQETITFICELNKTERTRTTKLTAIRISSCKSPQYCVSNSDQNSPRDYFDTIRCSDAQSKSCATILKLPLESRVSESSVDFYGRVSCLGSVDKKSGISHDFYFTGLSGNISLLSEFDGQPPLSEIFALEISRQNLTFAKISCKSLKFFTFPSIKMYVTFLDDSTEELRPTEGQSKLGETNHVYYREILRPIRYSNNISHITCFVPPYGSPDWADVTEDWPPDLVDIPIAVTGIPNTRTGKDNKFNGSNTVPPRTTRQPSKHRNRYRGGSGFMPPKKQDQSNSKKETVDQVESKQKIGGSGETHGISGTQIGGILACGIILILIFVPCFVLRYYNVQCMWHPAIKKSPEDEGKMETKIALPSRLKLSERNVSFDENQILSEGQFSFVYQGNPGKSKKDNLTFKVNKVAGDAEQMAALLNKVQVLGMFKKQHENIALIVGAHIDRNVGKFYIALDSENNTNFRGYMKNGNMVRQKILKMDSQIRLKTFITWFQGIANGMAFLHEQNIIHGSLAAENIFVFPNNNNNSSSVENNQVKITGFSYSQQLQKGSKYFKKMRSWTSEWDTSGWRWMSMESLRYMEFSKESDIWSFGVLMWEMFSFCEIPYTTSGSIFEFSNEFIQKLEFGIRLSQPALAPNEIYKKMNDCWNRYGKDRPSVTELSRFFNDILNNAQLYDNYYVYVQNS